MLPRVPDKQAANLIATGFMVQRTAYVKRVVDPNLPLPACRRADNGAMWMIENIFKLPGTAEESSYLRGGVHGGMAHTAASPTGAIWLVGGGWEIRHVVGRSEKDVHIGRELLCQRCPQCWLTSPAI